MVVGILSARHWLSARHGPISWHGNGKPAAKVTGVARVTRANALKADIGSELCHLPGRLYTGADGLTTFSLFSGIIFGCLCLSSGSIGFCGWGLYAVFILTLSTPHEPTRYAPHLPFCLRCQLGRRAGRDSG